MDRSKIVAVTTGIISLVLAIAYLLVVQIIDFRGEMLPAPMTLYSFQPLGFISTPTLHPNRQLMYK